MMNVMKHCSLDIDVPFVRVSSWVRDSDGRPMTAYEFETRRTECKKLGYKVFPSCDHIDKFGYCAGHDPKTGQAIPIPAREAGE